MTIDAALFSVFLVLKLIRWCSTKINAWKYDIFAQKQNYMVTHPVILSCTVSVYITTWLLIARGPLGSFIITILSPSSWIVNMATWLLRVTLPINNKHTDSINMRRVEVLIGGVLCLLCVVIISFNNRKIKEWT